jgi:hypothetical protein
MVVAAGARGGGGSISKLQPKQLCYSFTLSGSRKTPEIVDRK